MSKIERKFLIFLGNHPEVEKCLALGIINRRALAKYLIREEGIADPHQLEATVAMLRRFDVRPLKRKKVPPILKISIKDGITILDYKKREQIMSKLSNIINVLNYSEGDTLKIVVGTTSVRLFIDNENVEKVQEVLGKNCRKKEHVSEINLMFPEDIEKEVGILSLIAGELALHDVIISEMVTASPELIIYVEEKYTTKAYTALKALQHTLRTKKQRN